MHKKLTVSDLGYFGGEPLFTSVRPIGQLWLPDREKFYNYCESIFENGRLTNNGPLVRLLEKKLSEVHNCKYCIAFANASIAIVATLNLIARKTNKKKRGEVILPSFTYSGLPHLIRWAGLSPKFVDIEEDTHTISASAVDGAITDNVAAILAVHQVNSPVDTELFGKIAKKYSVPVVYDSVHGVFGSINGINLGNFGEAEIFSLHATKLINGFEGGYVTTNKKFIAENLKVIRNFGIISESETSTLGLNGKLNEIHAALALASLEDQDRIILSNKRRFEKYVEAFSTLPGVTWMDYPKVTKRGENVEYNYEFFLLNVPSDWPLSRDIVVKLLRAEGGMARGYYDPPVHLSTHFPKELEVPSLPVTEKVSRYFIQMPVGELVSNNDIDVLRDWFDFIYNNSNSIINKLQNKT